MAKMEVVVAGGELKQSVVRCHMIERVSDEDIGVTDVGRGHGEAEDTVVARLHVAFNHAAQRGRERLIVHHPTILEALGVYDEIRGAVQVLDVGELEAGQRRSGTVWPAGDDRGGGDQGGQGKKWAHRRASGLEGERTGHR